MEKQTEPQIKKQTEAQIKKQTEAQIKKQTEEQRKKQSGGKVILVLFFLIFVLGFGAVGAGLLYFAHAREESCSEVTEGRIIDYRTHRRHGSRTYSPVVEYQAGDEWIIGESNTWSSTKPLRNREYVTVCYRPENPEEFYIQGYDLKVQYRLGVIFCLFSAVIFLSVIVFTLLNKAKMNDEKKGKIRAAVFVAGVVFLIFIMFWLLAGPGITIVVFLIMGLSWLYGAGKKDGWKK